MSGCAPGGECKLVPGARHVRADGSPSCSGHSRGRLRPEIAGKPCRQWFMDGQKVCKVHGGMAPRALAAAEVRLAEVKLHTLAASLAEPIEGEDQDPAEIILESIRLQYRLVALFWRRVLALEPKAMVWGKTREKIGGDDGGVTLEPKAHAWYVLWRDAVRERDRLCLDAVKVGLEERRVRLAEREADAIVGFLDKVLLELGVDPADPQTAAVVERHLRLLA